MADENITSAPPPPQIMPPPPAPPARPEDDYRPVAAAAIFGLLIGGFVALLLLGSVVMSFSTGEPIVLPGWLVVSLALAGTVISFVAQRQIVAAEGTRTGMGLARWGIWLSVLTGIGFLVFDQMTDFVLRSQAKAFVMVKSEEDKDKVVPDTGFIPRLLEGCQSIDPAKFPDKEALLAAARSVEIQYNCAFLLTIPDRGGNDPKDTNSMLKTFDTKDAKQTTATRWAQFRDNAMVRFVRDSLICEPDKDKVKIEPLGVHLVQHMPPQSGKGRGSYRVVRNYGVVTSEIVRVFSLDVRSIEPSGPGERRKWYLALPQEQIHAGYRTPLGDSMKELRKTIHVHLTSKWNKADARKIRQRDVTKYEEFLPTKQLRNHVKNALADLDAKPGRVEIAPISSVEISPWRSVDGKIEIDYPLQVVIPGLATDHGLRLEGYITLASAGPVDPNNFKSDSPSPVWEVKSLHWLRISRADPKLIPK